LHTQFPQPLHRRRRHGRRVSEWAASIVSGSVGQAGPNEDYVLNTLKHLEALGIRDLVRGCGEEAGGGLAGSFFDDVDFGVGCSTILQEWRDRRSKEGGGNGY
jgi:hypothetical protein